MENDAAYHPIKNTVMVFLEFEDVKELHTARVNSVVM